MIFFMKMCFQDSHNQISLQFAYFIQVVMSQVPNIKYKTEYCHSWSEGMACEKGNACFFAHGEHELRTIQQNHDDIVRQNSYASILDNKSSNYKTIFCKFYGEGNCKLGDKCTYAHQRREKRKKRPSQEYNEQAQPETLMSWDNYQLYQYYAQAYMNQFMPQHYIYEPQKDEGTHEQQENYFAKVEGIQQINQSAHGSNNIKEQLTYNQPNKSISHQTLTKEPLSSHYQLHEQK